MIFSFDWPNTSTDQNDWPTVSSWVTRSDARRTMPASAYGQANRSVRLPWIRSPAGVSSEWVTRRTSKRSKPPELRCRTAFPEATARAWFGCYCRRWRCRTGRCRHAPSRPSSAARVDRSSVVIGKCPRKRIVFVAPPVECGTLLSLADVRDRVDVFRQMRELFGIGDARVVSLEILVRVARCPLKACDGLTQKFFLIH
jgi:hypothetical protein